MAEYTAELLRALQAFDDGRPSPILRCSDPSEIPLKYPDNVIVVPSPNGTSRPPGPGAITRPSISAAVAHAVESADRGEATKFSILVHSGIFPDLEVLFSH